MPTQASILDFFYRGVAGATVVEGGGRRGSPLAQLVDGGDLDRLPLKIEFIETREKVDELLGKLEEMAGSGMIEVQETMVAKLVFQASDTKRAGAGGAPEDRGQGQADAHLHRRERQVARQAPHRALVEAMRANDIAGHDHRGILGYGEAPACIANCRCTFLTRPLHHALGDRLRRSCRRSCRWVEQMVEEGAAVLSDVDIIKYSYRALSRMRR